MSPLRSLRAKSINAVCIWAPLFYICSATFAKEPGMGEISAISNGGTYVVLVHFDALELNELLELSVQISPRSHAQRATITGLHFSAEMPGHSHGMVTAPVSDKVNRNLFSIEGINFHMPGLWRLYFDIESEDITERAQFDLFVR